MYSRNIPYYKDLNLLPWITKYQGEGIKIGIIGYEDTAWHNGKSIIAELQSEAQIITYNVMNKGMTWEGAFTKMLQDDVDVVCCSLRKGNWSAELERLSGLLYEKGTILIDSADNEGSIIDAYPALSKYWFVCGAYEQKIDVVGSYSNFGPKLDFVCYTNIYAKNISGNYLPISHTSGSVQVPAAIVSILKQYCNISPQGFKQYLKLCCKDINEAGKDNKSGWGLLKMPVESIKIELQINNNTAKVDNVPIQLDSAPIIINNRTMVPLRFIAEQLDCVVEWDEEKQIVTVIK